MIALGIVDPNLPEAVKTDYFKAVKQATRQDWGGRLRGEENEKWVTLRESPQPTEMSVKEVQTVLRDADFFPNGKVDGICGYRTASAIRLFQEYLRTIGKEPGVFPDGVAGPQT